MNAINGYLDMSKSYRLVEIEYGCLVGGAGERCENCGNLITNVAIVESNEGKRFRIGLDCMETIVNMRPSELQEIKNKQNRLRRFVKMLKTQAESITLHPNGDGGYTFRMYKGIKKEWSPHALGWGSYEKFKTIIDSLDIPITVCER